MPDPASALSGAESGGIATVRDLGLQGMITVRGDLASDRLAAAASGLAGVDMPGPRGAKTEGARGILWMSPDELMVLVPHEEAAEAVGTLAGALSGEHHLVVDVSDARAFLAIEGPGAREALAKLAPVDLHPDSFGPGELRRTRLAQVPAAFWMVGADSFRVICFRSVARYAFDVLALSAAGGGTVGHF